MPPDTLEPSEILHYLNLFLTYFVQYHKGAKTFAINDYLADHAEASYCEGNSLHQGKRYLNRLFNTVLGCFYGTTKHRGFLKIGAYEARWLGYKGKELLMEVHNSDAGRHSVLIPLYDILGKAQYDESIRMPFTLIEQAGYSPLECLMLTKRVEEIYLNHLNEMVLINAGDMEKKLADPKTQNYIALELGEDRQIQGQSLAACIQQSLYAMNQILWQVLGGFKLTYLKDSGALATDYVPHNFDYRMGNIIFIRLPS